MKQKQDRSLNILLIVGLVIISTLLGFIVTPYFSVKKESGTPNLPSYVSGAVTIRTAMPKSLIPSVGTFLTSTVKAELLPKEILLIAANKAQDQGGDGYLASWNQNGSYISFLVTLTSNNSHINYQRIWIMPEARKLDRQSALTLLQEIFKPNFLSVFGEVTCLETQENNKSVTDCSKLKTSDSGDMHGITVKSPIELLPPPGTTPPVGSVLPTATVVSACFIPKEGTTSYTASFCI